MRVGESLQQLRCLSTGQAISAIVKDFGKMLLCYYRKVLMMLFRS